MIKLLEKYNFNFSEKNNTITVKLELAQHVKIECNESNKVLIKDKLVGCNFLIGMIEMSLKNALFYNITGTISFGIRCMYSENKEIWFNLIAMLLVFITWIILFAVFYIL